MMSLTVTSSSFVSRFPSDHAARFRKRHSSSVVSGGTGDSTGRTARRGAAPPAVHTGLGSYSSVSTTCSMPQVRQTRTKVSNFSEASYREVVSCRWSHMAAVRSLADAAGAHRLDLCRLVVAVKRRPVALEGDTTLRRLTLLPARVCGMDGLTRLAPGDPALDELVYERPQDLLLVRKMWK